jgi:hypothetical protein
VTILLAAKMQIAPPKRTATDPNTSKMIRI